MPHSLRTLYTEYNMKQNLSFEPLQALPKAQSLQANFVIVVLTASVIFFLASTNIFEVFSFPLGLLAFAVIWIVLWLDGRKSLQTRQQVLQNFADINNLTFNSIYNNAAAEHGSLFSHGHSQRGNNVLIGKLGELPYALYHYRYITGSGKHQTSHDLTVMSFTLPRFLPHMVIDSLVEPGASSSSALPITFNSSQRLTLEGDFSEYFALYAPEKYSISALSIIAPDVMMTLMEHAALCDIEIVGNKLYFYWPLVADSKESYEKIYATAEAILEEIEHKLSRANIYATQEHAQIHSSANPEGGVRLKQTVWLSTTVLSVLGFVLYILLFTVGPYLPSELGNLTPLLLFIVVMGCLLFALAQAITKQKKLRALQARYSHKPLVKKAS